MFRTAINVFQLCGNVKGIICSQVKTAFVNTNTIFWFLQTCVFACVEHTEKVFILFVKGGFLLSIETSVNHVQCVCVIHMGSFYLY